MTAILERLSREQVAAYWPVLKPYFEKATQAVETELTPDSIRHETLAGRRRIWVVFDPDRDAVLSVFSTMTITTNRGRDIAVVEACAGGDCDRWLPMFLSRIEESARTEGCVRVAFTGRLGWEPKTRPLGYRRIMSTMAKDL